jgi:hypothetical protein
MIRKALAVLGIALAVGGFVMLFDRGLAARLSTTQTALIPIGALALLQAYRVVRGRMGTEIEIAETDDPETEQDLAVPGEDFDEWVDSLASSGGLVGTGAMGAGAGRDHVIRNRNRVRDRLEEAAVATISNKWGCSEERARQALHGGTWTDDPYAVAYFSGDPPEIGIRERVSYVFSGEGRYQRRANRAARAIAELSTADAERLREEVNSR